MVFVLGGKLENQTKTRTTIVKTDITPNPHKEKPKQIKIKNKKNFGSYSCALFYTSCCYKINLCGIFEKMIMTSFFPIRIQSLDQGKLLAAVMPPK